jgi:hypothetical protein
MAILNASACGFSKPVSAEEWTASKYRVQPRPATIWGSSGTWLERIACRQPAARSRSSVGPASAKAS